MKGQLHPFGQIPSESVLFVMYLLFVMLGLLYILVSAEETQLHRLQAEGWNATHAIYGYEVQCWRYCDKGLYLYKKGNLFREPVCLCGTSRRAP